MHRRFFCSSLFCLLGFFAPHLKALIIEEVVADFPQAFCANLGDGVAGAMTNCTAQATEAASVILEGVSSNVASQAISGLLQAANVIGNSITSVGGTIADVGKSIKADSAEVLELIKPLAEQAELLLKNINTFLQDPQVMHYLLIGIGVVFVTAATVYLSITFCDTIIKGVCWVGRKIGDCCRYCWRKYKGIKDTKRETLAKYLGVDPHAPMFVLVGDVETGQLRVMNIREYEGERHISSQKVSINAPVSLYSPSPGRVRSISAASDNDRAFLLRDPNSYQSSS